MELGQGSEPVIAEAPAEPQVPHLDFLQPGEHLVQIHRFRYVRAVTCALGTIELVVEETLGQVQDPSKRCVARPDHPVQVVRPELTVYGESVKGAL